MKIIAINGSPRSGWNTDILVREAAAGAASAGAEVEFIDLYKLDKFTGCISCFGCKTENHLGKCVYKDSLADVLEKMRNADGIILGSPVYLGDISAGLRSLYERLIFQYISYKLEPGSYNERRIPVFFILTSNVAAEYDEELVKRYKAALDTFIGPTQTFICGNTLQVGNYEKYNWTLFNPEEKKERREKIFPQERKAVFELSANIFGS